LPLSGTKDMAGSSSGGSFLTNVLSNSTDNAAEAASQETAKTLARAESSPQMGGFALASARRQRGGVRSSFLGAQRDPEMAQAIQAAAEATQAGGGAGAPNPGWGATVEARTAPREQFGIGLRRPPPAPTVPVAAVVPQQQVYGNFSSVVDPSVNQFAGAPEAVYTQVPAGGYLSNQNQFAGAPEAVYTQVSSVGLDPQASQFAAASGPSAGGFHPLGAPPAVAPTGAPPGASGLAATPTGTYSTLNGGGSAFERPIESDPTPTTAASASSLLLKVRIAAVRGTKTVKFAANTSVQSTVDSLNARLPEQARSDHMALFTQTGQKLDASATLGECGVCNLQELELKRNPMYEIWRRADYLERQSAEETPAGGGFAALRKPRKAPLMLPHDINTVDAVRALSKWGAPPQIGRAEDEHGARAFKQHPVTGSRQELKGTEFPLLHLYKLQSNDILLLVHNATEEIIECVVAYSPLADDAPSPHLMRSKSCDEMASPHAGGVPRSRKPDSGASYIARKLGNTKLGNTLRMRTGGGDSGHISGPSNVVHKTHVDFDFQWQGSESPEEVFELGKRLGTGSWGSVFVATHRASGFKVACKVVQANAKARTVLSQEIEALKKCNNSALLSYFGTVLTDTSVWILTEYCAYGSIKDVMDVSKQNLLDQQIAYVVLGTLKGLSFLHAKKLVHLDIKSANIMLTEQGETKLGDFGGECCRFFDFFSVFFFLFFFFVSF
jgi:Protein kinase domain